MDKNLIVGGHHLVINNYKNFTSVKVSKVKDKHVHFFAQVPLKNKKLV